MRNCPITPQTARYCESALSPRNTIGFLLLPISHHVAASSDDLVVCVEEWSGFHGMASACFPYQRADSSTCRLYWLLSLGEFQCAFFWFFCEMKQGRQPSNTHWSLLSSWLPLWPQLVQWAKAAAEFFRRCPKQSNKMEADNKKAGKLQFFQLGPNFPQPAVT
jgi:hypothetical protein